MLLDLLFTALACPSPPLAAAQVEPPSAEPSLPDPVRLLIQLEGLRPPKLPAELLRLDANFAELPPDTSLTVALVESELRLQALGNLPEALRQLDLLRALLGSQDAHEEAALRIALARAKVSDGPEAARAALRDPYPSAEEARAAIRAYGVEVEPGLGEPVDARRLEAAFLEVSADWVEAVARLQPTEQAPLALAAPGAPADDAWIFEGLAPGAAELLLERFGAPSQAVAARVASELVEGGADHLQRLGSVAVPALALFAIAGDDALSPFLTDAAPRLNPLLELARLEPSAAYELIAALAPLRDAEWRQGAVGAYLRASQGVPIVSTSLWIRTDSDARLLQTRAPQRMAALAALLRDARTHGALAGELEAILQLDALPAELAEALGACLLELDEAQALALLTVVDPPGRSLRSNRPTLDLALQHAAPAVRAAAELSIARSGDWLTIAGLENAQRREALLTEAFAPGSTERRLKRPSEAVELYSADWVGTVDFSPHVQLGAGQAEELVRLFEQAPTALRRVILQRVPSDVPGAYERVYELALADPDEALRAAATQQVVFREPARVQLERWLPPGGEIRDELQHRWLLGFRLGGQWDERELLRLEPPLGAEAQDRLVRMIDGYKELSPEVAKHVGLLLINSPPASGDGAWTRLYRSGLQGCGLDAELLAHAHRQNLDGLRNEVLRSASNSDQVCQLVRDAGSELGPGWWLDVEPVSSFVVRADAEESAERTQLIAREILEGRLEFEGGLRWSWALEPYDQALARDAVLRLLETPGLDLGRLRSIVGETSYAISNARTCLWFANPLPETESAAQLLARILASEQVHAEVRADATRWLDDDLPGAPGLAAAAYAVLTDPERALPVRTSREGRSLGTAAGILARADGLQRVLQDVRARTYPALPYWTLLDLARLDPRRGEEDGLALRLLRDPGCDPQPQLDAVRLLAQAGTETAGELLLDVLPGVAADVRTEIRERISDIERSRRPGPEVDDTERVRQRLLDWIAGEGAERPAAVRSLGSVGSVADLPLLIELTLDDDALVRGAAAMALEELRARL